MIIQCQEDVTDEFSRRDRGPQQARQPWHSLDYTLVMEPGEARLPRPLIG